MTAWHIRLPQLLCLNFASIIAVDQERCPKRYATDCFGGRHIGQAKCDLEIEISATRVRKVIRHFEREKERTRAWRRILEQTTGALLRQSEDG